MKDQVLVSLIKFKSVVENQFISTLNVFNLIMEVNSKHLVYFLLNMVLKIYLLVPTPKQNGKFEHKMKHIVEIGLALLATAFLPFKFWIYAFRVAIFLINHMPTKVLQF